MKYLIKKKKVCFTASDVWDGIERLCRIKNKALSKMALDAGLDATSLYRYKNSKRLNTSLRIDTLYKILTSENVHIIDFIRLCSVDILEEQICLK